MVFIYIDQIIIMIFKKSEQCRKNLRHSLKANNSFINFKIILIYDKNKYKLILKQWKTNLLLRVSFLFFECNLKNNIQQ